MNVWSSPSSPISRNRNVPLSHGAYAAIGIFGQFVCVHPDSNLVVAMWSAQPKPVGTEVIEEQDFFNALAKNLESWQPD